MPNAPRKEFFLVSLPGLEDLVRAEVLAWFPEFDPKVEHGGVTVQAAFSEGLAMNLVLKTPTRILLRVTSFTCRDFPKLFKKISTFPWRDWVDPGCAVEVHAATARSRLKMKKRIAETGEKAWAAWRKKAPTDKTVALYIRLSDNVCTLSLDTSGERLHKRGERTQIGEAPLRETIAAALLSWIAQGADARSVELVDPLMGSGTFLLEAAQRDQPVDARDFPFANFKTKAPVTPQLKIPRPPMANLVGFELDPKSLIAARENLTGVAHTLHHQDFFSANPLPPATGPRWVLCNPPYGERLKVEGRLDQYYAKLFMTVEKVIRPDRACFLLPTKAVKGKLSLPREWKVLGKRPFSNGGIPVTAFLFQRMPNPR